MRERTYQFPRAQALAKRLPEKANPGQLLYVVDVPEQAVITFIYQVSQDVRTGEEHAFWQVKDVQEAHYIHKPKATAHPAAGDYDPLTDIEID